jgi:hypothetical protein
VVIDRLKIRPEHAFGFRGDGATHQLQGVHREKRVAAEGGNAVAPDKALGLQRHVVGLVSDALEIVGGRAVAGELVDAAEQHRHIIEFGPGPSFDVRNHTRRQIGVRAAEIELELNFWRACIAHSTLPRLNYCPAGLSTVTVLKKNCQADLDFFTISAVTEMAYSMHSDLEFIDYILVSIDHCRRTGCAGTPLKKSNARWRARLRSLATAGAS